MVQLINVLYYSHQNKLVCSVHTEDESDSMQNFIIKHQVPAVQSIVSLTKSLVNDSLSLLVRLKSSVLIFFC